MMRGRWPRIAWPLLAACAAMGGLAWAAPIAWNGAMDATWDNVNNWTPAIAEPTLADDVSFPAAIPLTGSTIALTAGELANNLTFNNSYTLTGGDLAFGAAQNINVDGNTVTVASALKDGGAGGYLKKGGAGTLILTGDNSGYTKWMDVNAGVVSVQNGSSVPGSYFHVTNAASVVELSGGITTPAGKIVYLSGTATNDDPSFRSVNGNNTWGGTVVLHGGAGRHNIGVDAGSTLTVIGAVSETSPPDSLYKVGGGTLILNGACTYTGETRVQDGTLRLAGGANRINPATSVYVMSAGTFDLNGQSQTLSGITSANGSILLNGGGLLTLGSGDIWGSSTVTGTGGLVKTGSGGLTIGAACTYSGGTNISDGTLWLYFRDNVLPTTGDVTIGATGTLSLSHANAPASVTQTINRLSGSGTVLVNAAGRAANFVVGNGDGSSTYAGVVRNGLGSVALTKTGTGTLTLSGDLDYTGATVVSGGTLRLAQAGLPFPGLGATGQFGSAHTVTVSAGATLEAGANWVFGDGLADRVVVNGGTLAFVGADNYLGNIELTGGQITTSGGSRPWRTGNWGNGLITVNASAASSTIAGSLTFVGTASAPRTTFNVADGAAADDLVVSAQISDHPGFEGRMRLVKDGPGTMLLSGANTFTGDVTVSQGIVKVGNKNAFGGFDTTFTAVTVASGGAVDFNGVVDATYGYTIAGTGVGGTGALVNTGGNIGTGSAQASNIRLSADATIGGTGNWALLASGYGPTTLDLAGHTLTKTGTNTISLCNTTVTAGTISIQQGTLAVAQRASDASAAAVTLANVSGAALSLGGFDLTIASLSGGGTTGGSVNLGANRLTVGDATSTVYAGVLSGVGGKLTKVGTGTLTLSGVNTYNGGTTVSAGTVIDGVSNTGAGAFGAFNAAVTAIVVQPGGTVDIDGKAAAGTSDFFYGLTLAGDGSSGQGALVNNGAHGGAGQRSSPNIMLTADATIGGTGNIYMINSGYAPDTLTLNGHTLTKKGTNTFYLCNTTVTAGTIYVEQGTLSASRASNASAAAIVLADAAGATLNLGGYDLPIGSLAGGGGNGGNVVLGNRLLTVGDASSTTYVGVISGTDGRLTKVGTGTLTLGGANTYTGATTVNGGALLVNGSITSDVTVVGGLLGGSGTIFGAVDVQAGGTVSAGNTPGHLLVGGAYTQGGTMLAELGGTGQGESYDWIDVDGLATLGGTIDVNLVNGFTPQPGAFFDILTASGGIVNVDLGSVTFDFTDAQTGMAWWASIVSLPGGGEALRLQAAPEPTTLALLALGGLALLRRRRRR